MSADSVHTGYNVSTGLTTPSGPVISDVGHENRMRTDLAQAFYNAAGVTDRTDPDAPASSFAVERIQDQLESVVRPGMRTLDLGCGAGRFTFAMESLGAIPTGMDCAAIPLDHARQIASQRNCRSRFQQGDILTLPFEKESFDLALLADNIVEFSPEDMETLSCALAGVLATDGIFCLSMKHDESPSGLKVSRYAVPGHGEFEYHTHPWTATRARSAIEKHLAFVREEALGENRHWLVFRKEQTCPTRICSVRAAARR